MGEINDTVSGSYLQLFHSREHLKRRAYDIAALLDQVPALSMEEYGEILRAVSTDAADNGRILTAFLGAGILADKFDANQSIPCLEDESSEKSEFCQILISEHDNLPRSVQVNDFVIAMGGVSLAYGLGFPEIAEWLLERLAKLHGRFFLENATDERFLHQTWYRAIGHSALSLYLLAAAQEGLLASRQVQIGHARIVGNPHLLELGVRKFTAAAIEYDGRCNSPPYSPFTMEKVDNRLRFVSDLVGEFDQKLDPDAHGLLSLDQETQALMGRWIESRGEDPSRPIVTVHVRTGKFRDNGHSGMRDWDIRTLIPSIGYLIENGYLVIRLGDLSMPRIRQRPGFIDYAHSDNKAPALDIAFVASAAFHLGSSSGMSLIPIVFGTPCLMLNWHSRVYSGPWGRRCWTIFKKIIDTDNDKPVSDFTRLRKIGMAEYPFVLEKYGARIEDLSSTEVSKVVKKFIEDPVSRRETDVTTLMRPRNFIFDENEELLECDTYGMPGGQSFGGSHRPSGYEI